jgi:hypothetical protein
MAKGGAVFMYAIKSFLASAIAGGGRLAARSGRFTFEEWDPDARWMGKEVWLQGRFWPLEEVKKSCFFLNRTSFPQRSNQ